MKFSSLFSHLLLLSHRMWWRFADHSHQQQQQTPESSNLEIRKKSNDHRATLKVQKKSWMEFFPLCVDASFDSLTARATSWKWVARWSNMGERWEEGKNRIEFFLCLFLFFPSIQSTSSMTIKKKVPAFCVRRWSDDVGVNLNFSLIQESHEWEEK